MEVPSTTAPPRRQFVARLQATRRRIRSTRTGLILFRTAVTVVGAAVIVVGIALLALPGPGWLIIFAGLGILASEYEWASRLLGFARRTVSEWTAWVGRQSRPVQALVGLAGLLVLAALAGAAWWFYVA